MNARNVLRRMAVLLLGASSGIGVAAKDVERWPHERAKITAERAAAEQRYQDRKQSCYQRFSVSACLDEARIEHQGRIDTLKKQAQIIESDQRKAKEVEADRRLQAKRAQEPERPARAVVAGRTEQARSDPVRSAQPKTSSEKVGSSEPERLAKIERSQERRRKAEERRIQFVELAAVNRQALEGRQIKADERRRLNQQKRADRTRPAAAPLPVG